jgi:DNA-binding transcriptional regulator YiaG
MTTQDNDIKVAITIKAMREWRKIKQQVVADALNITQASYCRIIVVR